MADAVGPLVVALGPVDPAAIAPLGPFGRLVVADPDHPAELARALLHSVALIARGANRVDAALLAGAPALQVIGRSGVGVDGIDLETATRRGIPVVITPGISTNAVAEGAFAMILHLVKRLGPLSELVRAGDWARREAVPIGDLEGSRLGVIGYGRIGRRTAQLGQGFGMEVRAHDPLVAEAVAAADGVRLVGRLALAGWADILSLHAPLTAATRGMVDAELLAQVRPGGIVVNCGRGGLLSLDAVFAALRDGRLAGVGLDVYEPEPPADHPLFHHPDVVLTPHVLGLTARTRRLTFTQMAEGMAAVLSGMRPPHVANPEVYRTG